MAKQGLVKRKKICQSSSTALYSLSGASKEGEKRRGAFRCKREGYALFKASHVQDVKYNFSDGNECEPFDSNFSNDSHLLISHSVLITPEDNPKGNQEKQFEEHCQEEPTEKKTTNEASQTAKNGNTSFVEIPYKGQVISDEFDLTNPMFREECQNFLSQIKINISEAIDVEERTRRQSSNPEWFKYTTRRLTASKFAEINNCRSTPAPDRLVRDLFQYRIRTTTPFQRAEGLRLEPAIKDKYVEYQLNHGHLGLSA